MSQDPEDAEEHPHPPHHQAVQGQAPLEGGEAGAFQYYGYSVMRWEGGVAGVGGRGEWGEVRCCGKGVVRGLKLVER